MLQGCSALGVPYAWVFSVLALESGFNPYARSQAGAFGLWQRMPSRGVAYAVADPIRQMSDAFTFWRQMSDAFHVTVFRRREAFYCLNLAPARLKNDRYDDETELYSAPSSEYRMNAGPFGLDPKDPGGVLRMRNLAHGLDAAVERCRARYDAECEAAQAVIDDWASPTHPARPNVQPGVGTIVLDRLTHTDED